jgi:Tol biopolymer transport system component
MATAITALPSTPTVPSSLTVSPTVSSAETSTQILTPTTSPSPTISPTINNILFLGGYQVHTLDVNTRQVTTLTPDRSQVLETAHVPPSFYCPQWSPDRQQIAIAIYGGSSSAIYLINADGREPRLLVHHILSHGDSPPVRPIWSPDGQKIAFVEDGEMFVIDANVRQSVEDPWSVEDPSTVPESWTWSWTWSPDAQLTRLTSPLYASSYTEWGPTWSPDGQYLVFSSYFREAYDIYVIDRTGRGLTQLTVTEADEWNPVWSPDGQHIAFVSDRDGNDDIYLMNPDGNEPRRFTQTPDREMALVWSPDSQKILYTAERDGVFSIYVMNVDGADQKFLATWTEPGFWYPACYYPVWSPDGQHIAFTDMTALPNGDGSGNGGAIYMIEADGANLTELLTWPDTYALELDW